MILTFFSDFTMRVICPQLGDSEAAATAPEEEKHETAAAGPVHQPMEGGLPSDDEEVLLPYGKELKSSESTVLPAHHQALLVQHQASPQAKSTKGGGGEIPDSCCAPLPLQ